MDLLKLAMPALLSSACNAIANTLWKSQFNNKPFNMSSLTDLITSVVNFRIIGGVFFYGLSMMLFFYLLSNYKLSQAIPFLATTYIFNYLIAAMIFNEKIAMTQVIGIIFIIIGVIISNLVVN